MNDKEFNALKRRIQLLIKRWVKPVGLGWWRINFVYEREQGTEDGHPGWELGASTDADWRYRDATITFKMDSLKELTDERLEEIFVHELMHVFLQPLRTNLPPSKRDLEESVATQLAHGFIWAREEKR